MRPSWKFRVGVGVGLAALALAGVSTLAQTLQATAQEAKVGNRAAAQVRLNGTPVITLYDAAGEVSLLRRAEGVAARLNELFGQRAVAADFQTGESAEGWALQAKGLTVVTATAVDADALRTTPEKLVKFWRTSLTEKMANPGKAPAKVTPTKPETKPQTSGPATSSTVSDPNRYDKKIVPIISVGQGIHVGAAEVVGPEEFVRQVKAVAQLEVDFKKLSGTRIRGMVPISTEKVVGNLKRVDRVAISMYGDVDPRKLF